MSLPLPSPSDPSEPPQMRGLPPRCRNCQAALTGEYCAACGQRDLPPDPTLRELLGEAWDAFVSVDGKVVSSLRLLMLKPGRLTTEYLAGHRARHLPPLRLYLVCSVLYFLVSSGVQSSAPPPEMQTSFSYAGDSGVIRAGAGQDGAAPPRAARAGESAARRVARDSADLVTLDSSRRAMLASTHRAVPAGPLDSATIILADSLRLELKLARELGERPGFIRRYFVTRFVRNSVRIGREKKNFAARAKEQLPRVMFVLMPLFAALLALVYRSRRLRFPSHLIVSLHVHAFAFAALTITSLVAALPRSIGRSAGLTAVGLWMMAYMPLALRRVYGGRLTIAVARSLVLATLYGCLALVVIGALALVLVFVY